MGERAVRVERALTQEDFDRFARLSGDDNPIHVDPAFSASSKFGRTVAHGALLRLILRGMAERLLPGAAMVEEAVMFPAPTFAEEPMRFEARVIDQVDGAARVAMISTRIADGVETCRVEARFVGGDP